MTNTVEPDTARGLEVLRYQAGLVREVVRRNLDGISPEESLRQPQPAGNCINWILGHLVEVYNSASRLLGQEPVMAAEEIGRYARGSDPVTGPSDALPFEELLSAWNRVVERFDAGLAAVDPAALDEPVENSPTGNPDETLQSLLTTLLFHQTYHAGQLGVVRRLVGKKGAIA